MSKGAEKIKQFVDSVDHFVDTFTNILITKGMGPTMTYTAKSLAAILSYKANNQVGPKVGYFVDGTTDKLTTLLNYLDEKNTVLKEQIQKDFEQKIDEYMPEKDRFSEESLAQINQAFSMLIDEKDDKEKLQLVIDLHRVDARVCWYLEKFSEIGISFENENTLNRNLAMLCELDPEMEPWIQKKLLSLVNVSIQ